MIKRIFILCLSILVIGYLVVAITTMNRKPDNEVCKGMELTVKDSVDYGYITPNGIRNILKNSKLYPEGKRLGDINVRALEKRLTTILHFGSRMLSYFRREGTRRSLPTNSFATNHEQ